MISKLPLMRNEYENCVYCIYDLPFNTFSLYQIHQTEIKHTFLAVCCEEILFQEIFLTTFMVVYQ